MRFSARQFMIGLALSALCLGVARADVDSGLQRATAAFYRIYLEIPAGGVPGAKARAKLAPVISHTLAQLLERADAAERHYAKVTKKQAPPLIEGDVFTSLAEGAQAFSVQGCTRNAAATHCAVELRHAGRAGATPVRWIDRVFLVRNGGRWVVDDIEFGGDWQFMHKGHLKELLRNVIARGNRTRLQ